MNAKRLLAFLLFVIPCAVLAFQSQRIAIPVLASAAALAGLRLRFRIVIRRTHHMAATAAIAVAFGVKWLFTPALLIGNSKLPFFTIGFLDYTLAYHIGLALITYQALLLLFRHEEARPHIFPLLSALVIAMAGCIPVSVLAAWRDTVFQSASLLLAALTGLYFAVLTPYCPLRPGEMSHRRGSGMAIMCLLLVTIAAGGWALGKAFYRYGDDVDRAIGGLMTPKSSSGTFGFPKDGRIGGIDNAKSFDAEAIQLRVFSQDAPGYLRGKVYDTYGKSKWTYSAVARPLDPAQAPALPPAPPGSAWFAIRPATAVESADRLEIQPVDALKQVLFTPLETAYVCAPARQLTLDDDGVPQAGELPDGEAYQCLTQSEAPREFAAGDRARLTALSEEVDPRIPALSAEITRNATTDSERVAAVVSYLTSRCTYSLDVKKSNAHDMVATFLFDSHAGHCELFASAAALLSRSAGVPCRYVTGFVADELNPFGGYWVARNKDAHAWVEAYIADKGWRVVEATPASGVPHSSASRPRQLFDYLRQLPRSILARLKAAGLQHLFANAIAWVPRGLWLVPGLVILAVAMWLVRRWRKRCPRPSDAPDPLVAALRQLLLRMDRALATDGLVRTDSETLHRFSARVEAAGRVDEAAWCRAYAKQRYGSTSTPADIQSLARQLDTALAQRQPRRRAV